MADSTLAFNILARDRGASSVFDKVARSADKTSSSLAKTGKISDDVANASGRLTKAHDAESDALGKVQIAEARLSDVRNNAKSKTSQIVAAENALATARRKAAAAGNVAQNAAKDLGNALDNEGKKAGKGLGSSLKKWFTGEGSGLFAELGKSGGTVFGSGILGALKTPILGPALIGVVGAAVATAMPAVGAIAGAALVTGFGAGIAGLGLVFAAKSEAVKSAWKTTLSGLGADMQLLSKPFESTLISIAGFFRRTVDQFNPALAAAFSKMSGPITTFVDQASRALEQLIPAIGPITDAFNGVLGALGPALQTAIGDISAGLTDLANSVSKNPQALGDLVTGLGSITKVTLDLLTTLNNINTGFTTLTGGVSLVNVVFGGLAVVIGTITGPFTALNKVIEGANALLGNTGKDSANAGASMADAASKTAALAGALGATGTAAQHMTPAQQAAAQSVADSAKKAADAKTKFEGLIASMFRLQNLALGLSGAQVNLQAAIDAASASVAANGRTLDINTEKGRANKTALNGVASSANAQTEAMLRSGKTTSQAAAAAGASRANFVSLAQKMGMSKAQAEALARSMIAIPKKTQTDFKADIRDLDSKIATAKRKLADKSLTATKKAQLQAEIAQLLEAKRRAQASIDSLTGKTVSLTVNTYKNLIQTTIPGGVGVKLPPPGKPRAAGGPVTKGQPYVVGEERPELFVPDENGNILPRVPSSTNGAAAAAGVAATAGPVDLSAATIRELARAFAGAMSQSKFQLVNRGNGAYVLQASNG